MKECPSCNATYDDTIDFCFVDGEPLALLLPDVLDPVIAFDDPEVTPLGPPPRRKKRSLLAHARRIAAARKTDG